MEASKGRRIDGAEQGGEQEEEQEQVIEVRKLVSRNASSRAVVPLNSDEEWASICLCLRPWVRSDDVWTALLGMLSGRRGGCAGVKSGSCTGEDGRSQSGQAAVD